MENQGFDLGFLEGLIEMLSTQILLIALAVVFLVAGIFTIILFYHWRKYGAGNATILMVEIIFLVGIVALLTAAAASATAF